MQYSAMLTMVVLAVVVIPAVPGLKCYKCFGYDEDAMDNIDNNNKNCAYGHFDTDTLSIKEVIGEKPYCFRATIKGGFFNKGRAFTIRDGILHNKTKASEIIPSNYGFPRSSDPMTGSEFSMWCNTDFCNTDKAFNAGPALRAVGLLSLVVPLVMSRLLV